MLTLDDLNPYSRRFATALFARFPEWVEFAKVSTADGEPGTLAVDVPSPGDPKELLWLGTFGEEVTVGFGSQGWHTHYGGFIDSDESTAFAESIETVEAIISEELAIATSFRGGDVTSSYTIYVDEELDFRRADRIEVLSWAGTRNASYEPPAR